MKATCHREGLLAACQLVSAALPASDVKPILHNFKAVASDGRCTLMATDNEVGIRLDVMGLMVEEPGEAILPAAKLIAILRESRDEQLDIEADPSACLVRGPSLEFEMPSEDPGKFPDLPTFAEDRYHEISAGTLREMIRRTIFAVADDANRYSLSGVMWELEDGTAKLVATDGHRLALSQGVATAHGDHSTKHQMPVVPHKAMSLLERNLEDAEDVVKICLRPNEVLFRTGRAVIYSRLVEGRFPDYGKVLPKKHNVRVPLEVAAFHAAVRQAAIMTDKDTRKVVFRFGKGKLTLQAQGAQSGRSKVELPIEYDHKPMDINLNPQYLVEMLKVLQPDTELALDLIDAASPTVFRSGASYAYVVMPMG
jgi:DNA polymerase-3 subunit beta